MASLCSRRLLCRHSTIVRICQSGLRTGHSRLHFTRIAWLGNHYALLYCRLQIFLLWGRLIHTKTYRRQRAPCSCRRYVVSTHPRLPQHPRWRFCLGYQTSHVHPQKPLGCTYSSSSHISTETITRDVSMALAGFKPRNRSTYTLYVPEVQGRGSGNTSPLEVQNGRTSPSTLYTSAFHLGLLQRPSEPLSACRSGIQRSCQCRDELSHLARVRQGYVHG